MLNTFKRHPLVFGDLLKSYTVVMEMSIGHNNESDCYFSDPSLKDHVEEFVRFVYATACEEYTHDQNKKLISSWKIYEPLVSKYFIAELDKRDKEKVHTVRLLGIYENNTIRFCIQFIEDERDYVIPLTTPGCTAKAFLQASSVQNQSRIYKSAYVLDLPVTSDLVDSVLMKSFYNDVVMIGLYSFIMATEASFNQLSRMMVESYREKIKNDGLTIKQLSEIKTPRFKDSYQYEFFIDKFKNAVDRSVTHQTTLEKDNEMKLISQMVIFEGEIKCYYKDTTGLPCVDFNVEISSRLNFQYPDGSFEKDIIPFYTSITPNKESVKTEEVNSSEVIEFTPSAELQALVQNVTNSIVHRHT